MAVEYQDLNRANKRARVGGANGSRAEARGRIAAMLALAGLAGCGHPGEPTADDPVPFVVPGWDVRSGATPIVRLVGGQSSDVPAVVTDRCAVEGVWRASSYE